MRGQGLGRQVHDLQTYVGGGRVFWVCKRDESVVFGVAFGGALLLFTCLCVCVFFFRGRDLNLCFLGHMWMSFAVFLFDV